MQDFRERIKHYERAYETITDDSLQYIKVFKRGKEKEEKGKKKFELRGSTGEGRGKREEGKSMEGVTDRPLLNQLFDVGKKIIANRITGYLPGRLVFFLMNIHITPRPIWLTRHGESEFNAQERIGIAISLQFIQHYTSSTSHHPPQTDLRLL